MEPSLVPLFIIAIVAAVSIVVELLSWLFVYRTATYKRIVSDIEAINKKFTIINSGPQVRISCTSTPSPHGSVLSMHL